MQLYVPSRREVFDFRLSGIADISGDRAIEDFAMVGVTDMAGLREMLDVTLVGIIGDLVVIGNLQGMALATADASGQLTLNQNASLLGSASASITVEATLSLDRFLTGNVAGISDASGALQRSILIMGRSDAVSAVSATLTQGNAFAGSVTATSNAIGMLSRALALAGATASQETVSAALTRLASLSGSVANTTNASGTITLAAGGDADAQAYINGYAPNSSSTFKTALNDFVVGLKADGLWSGLDWLCVPADTSAGFLRNLRNLAKTASAVNLPTYTAYRGFMGDGSSAHIDVNEPWSADGNNMVRDSGVEGIYINVQTNTANVAIMGNSGTTRRHLIQARAGTGSTTVQLNSGTAAVFETNPTTKIGHKTVVRADSASLRTFVNGAFVSNPASTSTSTIGVDNGTVLRSTTAYSPDRAALFYSGSAMSDSQVSAMNSRMTTFLTAIGAQ